MSLAEASGAGRARSALDTTGNDPPPRARRQRWQPAPVATPGEVNFHHPKLREYLGNLLNEEGGPFAPVDGDARKLIKELLHCRNPGTGLCCPSWPYLARAIGDCDRNVGYILGRLDSGPSRQSDKRIVEGHGLIWRRGGRCGFRRLPTQYGITCRFLILAGLVLPHNCMECRCGIAWGAEERGSISSGSSGSSSLKKSSKNGGEHRRFRAVTPSSKRSQAEQSDPVLDAFVAVFEQQRKAKYGDNDHGSLARESRVTLGAYLADLVGGAWAWSEQEGMRIAWSDVTRGLCEGLARLWLDWPGSSGLLIERHHPIGLLIGDLEKFGKLAGAAWKRAQRRPKPLAEHEAPPGEVSATTYAAQLQAERAAEAWPELDASEADAEDLDALEALAQLQPQEPERSATAEADELAPAVDPIVLAQVRRAIEERAQIAASAAHSRALLAALYPPADCAGLAAPLGAVALGLDAGEAGLCGLDLAGEREERFSGIGDDDASRSDGFESGIEQKIGAVDDVPPRLRAGGGPGDGGIESSEAGSGETDRHVLVSDGAAVCLRGASHEATVPRRAGEFAAVGIGVSREPPPRAQSRGIRVTRQTPRPLSLSEFREQAQAREKAAKGAGFSVSREHVRRPNVQTLGRPDVQTSERSCPWNRDQSGGARGGPLGAPIVALGRGALGVTGEPLHDPEIGPGIEQIPDPGPPHVVRADVLDRGALGGASDDPRDPRLPEGGAEVQRAALLHRAEERPRRVAAHGDPGFELGPDLGDVAPAILVPLPLDTERPGAAIEVGELEGAQLGAAETGDAEHAEQSEIAHAAGGRPTRPEE